MPARSTEDEMVEKAWRTYLTKGESEADSRRRGLFKLLPGNPRCKNCYAPFKGIGGGVVRIVYGKQPSNLNPQLCNVCEEFAKAHQGGAEVELSLLFADVRGSTALAEEMGPGEYSKLINRFYDTATRVLVGSDALIDKIIGDQVAGMYVPGIAGPAHARHAVAAGVEILRATGHDSPDGPWIPLGAGVHTGVAFVGSVGSEGGATDITVLGDAANTTARLAGTAGVGELLVSEGASAQAGVESSRWETRELELKGKSKAVKAHVLSAAADFAADMAQGQ